jgi:hypothetical protein
MCGVLCAVLQLCAVLGKFTDNPKKYVLHCMYSRERAPTCAEMLLAKIPAGQTPPDVRVLTGGFNAWLNHWSNIAQDSKANGANGQAFALKDTKRVTGTVIHRTTRRGRWR